MKQHSILEQVVVLEIGVKKKLNINVNLFRICTSFQLHVFFYFSGLLIPKYKMKILKTYLEGVL